MYDLTKIVWGQDEGVKAKVAEAEVPVAAAKAASDAHQANSGPLEADMDAATEVHGAAKKAVKVSPRPCRQERVYVPLGRFYCRQSWYLGRHSCKSGQAGTARNLQW